MKFCRFSPIGSTSTQPASALYGLLEGDRVRDVTGPPWSAWSEGSRSWPAAEVRLLAPVEPGKIVCVGRNYAAHAAELGNEVPKEPLIFLKPPSAIIGPGEPIVLTMQSQRVEHEGELALIVGKRCSQLKDSDDALSYLFGYSCLNDVTARDLQNKDGQWTRAKGFDTFCPVGPLVTDEIDPWAGVGVETRVNGELRQQGNTRDFIFGLGVIIRYITQAMTLVPGDLIATGTPKGVGPVVAGDVIEITVDGVGTLRNPVVNE